MKKLIILSIVISFLLSNDSEILSKTKQDILKLKEQNIKQKAMSNRYDWVNDINLKGSYTKNQDDIGTQDYSINFSQDIYKFGGISSQIQYAKELEKLELLDIKMDKQNDLSTLYSLLISIKLNNIQLEQNSLSISNSKIEIDNKQSQYKLGEIGISDLNNAIITKNSLSDIKRKIELEKLININSIKKLTFKDYKSIAIPSMKFISKELFLTQSVDIRYANIYTKVKDKLYEIKKTNYLPTLSINGNYGYKDINKIVGDDYYSYGINLIVPVSYTSSSDIEQSKLNYLESKKTLEDKKIELSLTYDTALQTIKSYEDRINLALQDIKLYDELIELNKEEQEAGYKTIDDVTTLQNSKDIRLFDIKSYKLNLKNEILKLYFLSNK